MRRENARLITPKQRHLLKSWGFDAPENMTKETASRIISNGPKAAKAAARQQEQRQAKRSKRSRIDWRSAMRVAERQLEQLGRELRVEEEKRRHRNTL